MEPMFDHALRLIFPAYVLSLSDVENWGLECEI
jgi:hypothetical protein